MKGGVEMGTMIEKLLESPSLGTIGTILMICGFFLVISGLEIFKIEKITVKPGRKTWICGIILLGLGAGSLFLSRSYSEKQLIVSPEAEENTIPHGGEIFIVGLATTNNSPDADLQINFKSDSEAGTLLSGSAITDEEGKAQVKLIGNNSSSENTRVTITATTLDLREATMVLIVAPALTPTPRRILEKPEAPALTLTPRRIPEILEDFTKGDGGWTAEGGPFEWVDGGSKSDKFSFDEKRGNFVHWIDEEKDHYAYYVAPESFTKQLSGDYLGGTLEYWLLNDRPSNGSRAGKDLPDVVLEAADGTVLYFITNNVSDQESWQKLSINLQSISHPNCWYQESATKCTDDAMIRWVLDNLDALKIRAEYWSAYDKGFLDDVRIIPPEHQ